MIKVQHNTRVATNIEKSCGSINVEMVAKKKHSEIT